MKLSARKYIAITLAVICLMITAGCSMQKNTAMNRFRNAFTAKYNTYYNGSQAFIDGAIEKETGNKDNFTEMIPLYTVGNKASRDLGKGNFERAILKSEKAIKLHSMKQRPQWTKKRRKTAKDIEWLSRREYNPFIWRAWLLMGKSQFQMGNFDEAAATFSYMARLYATQPAINGIARAWLAKSYVELDWLYDAEDVITKMRRDTMHYKAEKDWDYTMADYYIRSHKYNEAIPYLRKAIKHEKRRKQKGRMWFLMGQMQSALGNNVEAYEAYGKVIRMNPPYELEFNARIAQTEVMAGTQAKKMIRKLRRMARSDNNKEYLDQVYYAIGNIYLSEKDTLNAIGAYETGNKESTRNGIEKGVLLLKLGDLYWQKEKYSDAKRCYGEAIGLLDKERPDYEVLSKRSAILDELVPHTDAVYLQDSLLVLAELPEAERNEAIDRVIEELKKKEEEEKRAEQEAEVERQLQKQGAQGNRPGRQNTATTATTNQQGVWYFYNPMAVNQGKTQFQKLWGKRENVDDWQRSNRTVVNLNTDSELADGDILTDSLATDSIAMAESTAVADEKKKDGELDPAEDPHKREYYMAQIPFTDEQKQASHDIIKDGLFNSGVIFKDKLDNLPLSEKALKRLTTQYPEYGKNDEAWYHLWLLYSRMGHDDKAAICLTHLQTTYPENQWTILLSDPYFAENAKFGVHIEDSLYAATYEAFKADRHQEIMANAKISRERFPLGANRPKFIFIEGLSLLNDADVKGCIANMTEVVEKYPQNEISPMAGMILKGVQAGRTLEGGAFDLAGIWERRSIDLSLDSTAVNDTLSIKRDVEYTFMLAFTRDSVNENQLLYDMAKYNFSSFMVRNFDMAVDEDNGIRRMMFTGFQNYDEALQYARQLASDTTMTRKLQGCRRIIISNDNLKLLGIRYSYNDYETFFQESLAPLPVSEEELLEIPERTEEEEMATEPTDEIIPETEENETQLGESGAITEEFDFEAEGFDPVSESGDPLLDGHPETLEAPSAPELPKNDTPTSKKTTTEKSSAEKPVNKPAEKQTEEKKPTNPPEEEPIDELEEILGPPPGNNTNEPESEIIDFDEDFYR